MRKPVMSYANNKGADQPVHRHSLISAFVVHRLDSVIPALVESNNFKTLASVAEHTGLSLMWSKTGFLVMWLKSYKTMSEASVSSSTSDLVNKLLGWPTYTEMQQKQNKEQKH